MLIVKENILGTTLITACISDTTHWNQNSVVTNENPVHASSAVLYSYNGQYNINLARLACLSCGLYVQSMFFFIFLTVFIADQLSQAAFWMSSGMTLLPTSQYAQLLA